MRTWGRITTGVGDDGVPIRQWVKIETAADGTNDMVYLTAMIQVLLLMINESPFYADWGIPARESVAQQVPPDYYVNLTQQRFAGRFASLLLFKRDLPTPTYEIKVVTNQGVRLDASIPIPT